MEEEGLEVLVISSQKGKGMLFPKVPLHLDSQQHSGSAKESVSGDKGYAHVSNLRTFRVFKQAALRETVEEAGVLGAVEVRSHFTLSNASIDLSLQIKSII